MAGCCPFMARTRTVFQRRSRRTRILPPSTLTSEKRSDVVALLQRWTEAAAALTRAVPLGPPGAPDAPAADSGDVLGLKPSRLTLTFGFGPGVFTKDGTDRYGLAARRPAAFVDLPKFVGDQLDPARTGGDLSVQACGDDQQAVMSAVRQLMRLAYGAARRALGAGRVPAGLRSEGDTAQPDGFQGRHVQRRGRPDAGDGRACLGGR